MEFIADILLIGGALAATAYCVVLSRRLKRFTDLEKGVGGAIAVLSAQVDDMTKTLKVAQTSAAGSAQSLDQLTGKAENAARRLELLVASMHDIPESSGVQAQSAEPVTGTSSPANTGATQNQQSKSASEKEQPGPVFLTQRQKPQEAAE